MAETDQGLIREAALVYAQACDRRDAELLASVMTDDTEIAMPGFPVMSGADLASNTVATLSAMFDLTQHRVFNTLFTVNGDEAVGETYCSANHLHKERRGDQGVIEEWAIRYQDVLQKADGRWRFKRRELIIDWKQEHLVSVD